LVAPTRGITPASIVFRVTEAHKPPHHDKVATTGEVFFLLVFFIFYFFKFFLKFFLKLKKNPAWILHLFSMALGSGTPYISSWFVLCLVLPLWVIFI
jgi:hypothetical protein